MNPGLLGLAALLIGSLASSGCGTVCNVQTIYSERPRVFGGVREDLACFFGSGNQLACYCAIIDFPLSLVGDLVTMPWVVKAIHDARAVKPVALPVR